MTGREILQRLDTLTPLAEEDAEEFLEIVAENRASERWNEHNLR